MTTYYFYETNGYNGVMATDGVMAFDFPVAYDGTFEGIDLYKRNEDGVLDREAIVQVLKQKYYDAITDAYIYEMQDIERDYPDSVYPYHEDDWEDYTLTEICSFAS